MIPPINERAIIQHLRKGLPRNWGRAREDMMLATRTDDG